LNFDDLQDSFSTKGVNLIKAVKIGEWIVTICGFLAAGFQGVEKTTKKFIKT